MSLASSRKSAAECSLLERLWKHVRLACSKWLKMPKGGMAAEASTARSLVLGDTCSKTKSFDVILDKMPHVM